MRFRPGVISTVLVFVSATITINLSLWQYGRHQDQTARLAEVAAAIDGPPLTASSLSAAPDELKWHKAMVAGTFEADSRRYISDRFLFGRPGYQVVEVLAVQDGPRLLVDRGWIPAEDWSTHAEAITEDGPVDVRGLLLPIEPGPRVTARPADDTHPARLPQETESFLGVGMRRIGLPWQTLADEAGDVAGVYLVAGDERVRGRPPAPTPLPVDGYIAQPKVIGHLSYAGQWALITVVMIAVWFWASLARGRAIAA